MAAKRGDQQAHVQSFSATSNRQLSNSFKGDQNSKMFAEKLKTSVKVAGMESGANNQMSTEAYANSQQNSDTCSCHCHEHGMFQI